MVVLGTRQVAKAKPSCQKCKHFWNADEEGKGTCRRFPPTLYMALDKSMSGFPTVMKEWICGEFVRAN